MRMRRIGVRLCLFIGIVLLGLSSVWVTAPADAAPRKPKINWTPCYRDTGYPFECGTLKVPLDYSRPGSPNVSLAVIRLPASDPARRIGSLFFNPGGPGGSGVDFIRNLGPFLYTEELRARFDLVGFDPRGIARSTPLLCFKSSEDSLAVTAPIFFPVTPADEGVWENADRRLAAACDRRGGAIIDHMSTADVARDLDQLREAVGDAQLNFVGYSYGSYLGVTYANLFPDKVRAVVVDGVLDPVEWATGTGNTGQTVPFSTRLRSSAGAQATLNEFFRLCDAEGASCAFSGNAEARFAALAERLKIQPVDILLPNGTRFRFTYADLIANTLSVMYSSSIWPQYAQFLASLDALSSPATLGIQLQAVWEQSGLLNRRSEPRYINAVEGFPGVSCADTDNPTDYAAWRAAAAASEAQDGYFGPLWTWISSICAVWPGESANRYTGPFTAATVNPVLVVGTTYDPATRYEGALAVNGLLPNSSLLTVEGWGHTSLFLSQCADQAVSSYVISGVPPSSGTVCQQDFVPFASALAANNAALRSFLTDALLPVDLKRVVR